jgi:hypothetical protein
MAVPVLIEVPIEVMILILSPYFVAVILTIIYVHKKYKFTKKEPSNDYDDSGSNNSENSMANPT